MFARASGRNWILRKSSSIPYRRNLQRAYLDQVNTKVNNNAAPIPAGLPPELAGLIGSSGDERPLYRAELGRLNAAVTAAIAKTTDRETKAHLEDSRNQIAKILDPKLSRRLGKWRGRSFGSGSTALIRCGACRSLRALLAGLRDPSLADRGRNLDCEVAV